MGVKGYLFGFAILLLIFMSACTSDRPYEQPQKIESKPTENLADVQPEKPKIQLFKVGESATDGGLKITMNSFSFKDKLTYTQSSSFGGEEYESSFDMNPKEGYQFLIIDLTIENLQTTETSTISSLLFFDVSDADGYSYDYSLGTAYLDRKFEDGDLLPGMKKRGNVAFEVPKNPVGLNFMFKFDLLGQTAIFDLEQ